MAERGFGEPSTDREVFDRMEERAQERNEYERRLAVVAGVLAVFAIALSVVAVVVSLR